MNGINLIEFMAADFLLPVNPYNMPVMIALGISPNSFLELQLAFWDSKLIYTPIQGF